MQDPNSAGFTITATHAYSIKLIDRLKLLFLGKVVVKTYIAVKDVPTVIKDSGEIIIN